MSKVVEGNELLRDWKRGHGGTRGSQPGISPVLLATFGEPIFQRLARVSATLSTGIGTFLVILAGG